MKLYFNPFSGNSRRALLVANHLGLELEHHELDLQKGEQRGEAHLGRNPNGRVPVLDDNGFVLWESRAIMQYLCDKTPGQTLLPLDPVGRADVSRWLFWDAAHSAPAATILVMERFVKKLRGLEPDAAEVARGEALLQQTASLLDTHLAGKQWVCQAHLTLADYSIAAAYALAGPAQFAISEFENLTAWLARVAELEAWKRTVPPLPPAR